jgi:hypothetical protein
MVTLECWNGHDVVQSTTGEAPAPSSDCLLEGNPSSRRDCLRDAFYKNEVRPGLISVPFSHINSARDRHP